jgi:hypothetical protein
MVVRYLQVLPMIALLLEIVSSYQPMNIFVQCNTTHMDTQKLCTRLEVKMDKISAALGNVTYLKILLFFTINNDMFEFMRYSLTYLS